MERPLEQEQTSAFDGQYERDARLLSAVVAVEGAQSLLWSDRDLTDVLGHQLTSPLEYDLRNLGGVSDEELQKLIQSADPPLRTFDEVFRHPSPPLELLRLIKEFAKAANINPPHGIPRAVATVIYLAAIAAALVRLRTRLTNLPNEDLRDALNWGIQQSWVDESIRALLAQANSAVV